MLESLDLDSLVWKGPNLNKGQPQKRKPSNDEPKEANNLNTENGRKKSAEPSDSKKKRQ